MKPATILIAENDPAVSRILAHTFRRAGYETLRAFDGERALELISARRVDALIAEAQLPGGGARELTEQLVSQEETPRPFVIVTTSHSDAGEHHWLASVRNARLEEKPVSPRRLLRLVTEAIQARTSGDGAFGEEQAA